MKSNKKNTTTQSLAKNNNNFYLDIRSITLFRICLGLAILYKTIFFYFPNFESFSPENSFFGNYYLNTIYTNQLISPIDFIQSDWMMYVFFFIIMLLSVFLIVGFYSKIAIVFLYLFSLFFYQRFMPLTFGWDRYYDVILLFAIFLPLDRKLAINTYFLNKNNNNQINFYSPFILLLFFTVFLIYFIAGIGKNGHLWLNGNAVGFLLKDSLMVTKLGYQLAGNVFLSKFFTYLTLVFEIVCPFFLFIKNKNQIFRLFFAIAIILFHWGLGLFVEVGFFKHIALATAILLLPNYFWSLKGIQKIGNFIINKKPLYYTILPFIVEFISYKNNILKYISLIFVFVLIYNEAVLNFKYVYNHDSSLKDKLQFSELATSLYNLPSYSNKRIPFFHPDWFFYAPNPPRKSVYMAMEFQLNNKKITYFPKYKNQFSNTMPIFKWNDIQRFQIVRMKKELMNNITEDNMYIKFFGYTTEMWLAKHKNLQPKSANFIKYYSTINDSIIVYKFNMEQLIQVELAY